MKYLLTFCLLIFISCKSKHDTRLTIYNNADHSILVLPAYNYPDTIDYILNPCVVTNESHIYEPNSSGNYSLHGKGWESFLSRLESNTVMLYIYNLAEAKQLYYNSNDCSLFIGKELKRVDITMDLLNENNFTITYP